MICSFFIYSSLLGLQGAARMLFSPGSPGDTSQVATELEFTQEEAMADKSPDQKDNLSHETREDILKSCLSLTPVTINDHKAMLRRCSTPLSRSVLRGGRKRVNLDVTPKSPFAEIPLSIQSPISDKIGPDFDKSLLADVDPQELECDVEFSQISPSVMKSMCDAAFHSANSAPTKKPVTDECDSGRLSDMQLEPGKEAQFGACASSPQIKSESSFSKPSLTPKLSADAESSDVASEIKDSGPVPQCGKAGGLMSKLKSKRRFLYPNSEQIEETCPSKVFSLKPKPASGSPKTSKEKLQESKSDDLTVAPETNTGEILLHHANICTWWQLNVILYNYTSVYTFLQCR